MMAADATGPLIIPANNSMQRTALRAAADAERWAALQRHSSHNPEQCRMTGKGDAP